MPLREVKPGQFVWVETEASDIKEFREKLRGEESGDRVKLTYSLKRQIDKNLASVSPLTNMNDLADSNRKLYATLRRMTKEPVGLVDIILPVHGALKVTRECIDYVFSRTSWPFHLYIVDDASDQKTAAFIDSVQKTHPDHVTVLRNKVNRGFAASVNRGIRTGNGKYICLLNSDVFVTDGWLTKMILALQADVRNAIVCPITNNTALIEVPLSQGASYRDMNRVFQDFSRRSYPEIMPTGFCFAYRRELVSEVGPIDPSYVSYGEETDFWYRTIRHTKDGTFQQYRAVLADDTYVFHQRGVSFTQLSAEQHDGLRKLASGRFNRLWPDWVQWKKHNDPARAMKKLRVPLPFEFLVSPTDPYRVCWVMHDAKFCGAVNYICDIVNALLERGVRVKVAVIKRRPESAEAYHGDFRVAPVYFDSSEEFVEQFKTKIFPQGILVASTVELSAVAYAVQELSNGKISSILHAQSYEMAFAETPEVRESVRRLYGLLPDVIVNSSWVAEAMEKDLGIKALAVFPPGVDSDVFYPRQRVEDDRHVVMVLLRKDLKCRGYERGLALIQEMERLALERGLDLQVLAVGPDQLPIYNETKCLGELSHSRLSKLLATEVDVFVDPSTYHSYGLPALEAAASAVKVFGWDNKGIMEWAPLTDAAVFPADFGETSMAEAILDYLVSPEKTARKPEDFIPELLKEHERSLGVQRFILALEERYRLLVPRRRIAVFVPHLRKHGGPTTLLATANGLAARGHDVTIYTYYPDINDEVAGMTSLPIKVDSTKLNPCDVAIINSDHPLVEQVAALPGVKTIMLKLSHNGRFKGAEELGLRQKWDAIVTSTEWLVEACAKPIEGWDHPAQKAVRMGWWHYGHESFKVEANARPYGGQNGAPLVIGTLIHAHPSKGTQDAIRALGQVTKRLGDKVQIVGVGEVPAKSFECDIKNMPYLQSPTRQQMADLLRQVDIWVGASHTEGLGRMGLEAMSARCAVVLSDTGAEYAVNGENCLTFPVGDAKACEKAILQIAQDPQLGFTLRHNGFRTAEKYADSDPAIDVLESVIDSVFEGK